MMPINKNIFFIIPGQRVALHLLRYEDIELIRQWRNQDHIRKWFKFTGIISKEQQQQWWEAYRQKDDDLMFLIYHCSEARPLGTIALYNIDRKAGAAEFGRLLIPAVQDQGQGFATEASRTLIDWAWRRLALRRIYLEVRQDNDVALKLYTSLGFQATQRQTDFITMQLERG
jgi:RimJ/RimL family protein N-acetyltransferase